MNRPDYQSVGKSVRKKDSLQLLLGKPVYTDDIVPDALVVKLLRSPHANAIVETIDTSKAKKLPDVVDVYTWEDVPNERFSNAGQTYPETSPYDRLIIDRHVRFVGDVVAIVAAETEEAAEKALGALKLRTTCWSRCWISAPPKTTPYWCTLKATGICCATWAETTRATW